MEDFLIIVNVGKQLRAGSPGEFCRMMWGLFKENEKGNMKRSDYLSISEHALFAYAPIPP